MVGIEIASAVFIPIPPLVDQHPGPVMLNKWLVRDIQILYSNGEEGEKYTSIHLKKNGIFTDHRPYTASYSMLEVLLQNVANKAPGMLFYLYI